MRVLRVFPTNGCTAQRYEDVEDILDGRRGTLTFKLKSGLDVTLSAVTDWILEEKADNETPDRG